MNKTRIWIFEKFSRVDKPLAQFIRKKKEKTQVTNIRNERGDISADFIHIKRIIMAYYEQL